MNLGFIGQKRLTSSFPVRSVVFGGVLSGLVTIGCSSGADLSSIQGGESAKAPETSAVLNESGGSGTSGGDLDTSVASAPGQQDASPPQLASTAELVSTEAARPTPQLIKTAELQLVVEDTSASINTVVQLVRQQQGDVLQLQDSVPVSAAIPHQAYLQIRVPQNRLDQTLQQLTTLGKVQNQSVTAEDVSDQLVDYEARLRNLRKSEEMLLKIMEQSGEIGDVLKVAQELNTVRESIERINAQLQTLKTRVAFSTINLYLEEPVANVPLSDRTWSQELQQAWQGSTRSLSNFTRGVVVLGIWLLVYSPYWLVLAGGIFAYRVWHSRHPKPETVTPTSAQTTEE